MKIGGIVKYCFSLVGAAFLAASFFSYTSTNKFLSGATKTEGVVIDLVQSRSDNSTTYAPVINFTDQAGVDVEFTSSVSSNPPKYTKGEKVDVLYLSSNSQDAKINDFFRCGGSPLSLVEWVVCSSLLVLALCFLAYSKIVEINTLLNTEHQLLPIFSR